MAKAKTKSRRRWRDAPSPCIDVCKYPDGICKGCGMTRAEKKGWRRLVGKAERKPLLEAITRRLSDQGGRRIERWRAVYRRKCTKKTVPCPLDRLDDPAD